MIKRPLGIIGAVFFITTIVLSHFGFEKALYMLPVFLITVFFVLLKQKKIKLFAVISSVVLCASVLFYVTDMNFRTYEEYFAAKNVKISGVICEKPYFSNNKYHLVIKTDKINSDDVSTKIKVSSLTLPEGTELYDRVNLKANLYAVDSMDDGVAKSYKSKRISLIGSASGSSLKVSENTEKPIMYYILSYRYKLVDVVSGLLDNDIGGFISGITFGEKDLLSDEALDRFRVTGTSHILVVSGLHTAMWSGILYKLLRLLLSRKVSSVVSILFLVIFMAFTGFTPSVIRAGIMMIFTYIGIICGEKPDSLNTLGISALILTAIDPFSVYNVGTVFSFASVFGILLMNNFLYDKINSKILLIKNKAVRKILSYSVPLVLVSLSAQIFTYPICVLYNIRFSLLSVVSNFFISSLSTVTMVTGGIGTVVLDIFSNSLIGKVLFAISILTSKLIYFVVDKLAQFEQLYVNVSDNMNYIFICLVLLLVVLLAFVKLPLKRKTMIFTLFLIPAFLVSNLIPMVYKTNFIEFAVIDVEDGMCATFSHNNEAVMLCCGGGYSAENKISDYLEEEGVQKIKAVFLPVNNSLTLVNKAKYIKEKFEIESVVTSAEYKFSFISPNVTSADLVRAEYFGSKLVIDYYTMKDCSFALAKVGGKRILINFYGKLNEETLPQSCINPDVYVTMYKDTYITDFSFVDEYVVSTDYITTVPASANKVHTTFNDSTYIKSIKV